MLSHSGLRHNIREKLAWRCALGGQLTPFIDSLSTFPLQVTTTPPYASPSPFPHAGDDDTLFFMPNVLSLLGRLDHKVPMALTENLWWGAAAHLTSLASLPPRWPCPTMTDQFHISLRHPCPHFRYRIQSDHRTHNGHPHPAAPRCVSCAATGTVGLESEGSLTKLPGGEVRSLCVVPAFHPRQPAARHLPTASCTAICTARCTALCTAAITRGGHHHLAVQVRYVPPRVCGKCDSEQACRPYVSAGLECKLPSAHGGGVSSNALQLMSCPCRPRHTARLHPLHPHRAGRHLQPCPDGRAASLPVCGLH